MSDIEYSITQFVKASADREAAPKATAGRAVTAEPAQPIADLSSLDPYGVPDRVKVIIAQGHHPEETKPRDNSQSAWLFDAVCNLFRHGVPERVVRGIIGDPAWGISASVLNKGGGRTRYEDRQIERAKLQVTRDRSAFSLTDVGNGERLAAHHGEDMRYCYPWKAWLAWDGDRFSQDDSGEAHRRAKLMAASIYEEAGRIAARDPDRAKAVAAWARLSQSRRGIEAALVMAQSELPVRTDELDANDNLLNLKSGTLDLLTLTHREHNRDDCITKLAPVEFDPDAKCPIWLAFLDRIYAKNKPLIAFMQRAVGYTLTGETSEQVLFLMHGSGKNGKSTMLETLGALLGDYARPTDFQTLLVKENSDKVRNDIAALVGLRLVTSVEVSKGKRLDEAVVKQLTGGDKITARFLHKEFFDFHPKFKLFLAANHKPHIQGVDEAIWRRVMLVPHLVTIPEKERDKKLVQKLHAELPGILNWALEGLRDWRANGLMPPDIVLKATGAYREEMDRLVEFLEAECEVNKDSRQLWTFTNDLYQRYDQWCLRNGDEPVTKRTFGTMLEERGFAAGHKEAQRGRYGVRLLSYNEQKARRDAEPKDEDKPPF